MKLGIGVKLGLLLAFFGIIAAGLTGYYSFSESRDLLVKAAQNELLTSTQVLGRRFSILMNETARNVRLLSTLPSAHGVFDNDSQPEVRKQWESRLAAVFESMLKLHPEYFQVRLIGASDHGRERVRVDRTEHGFSQVTGLQLQEKAQYPYVYETLQLAPGQFYLSPIFVNHETGVHLGIDKPTVLVATPVTNSDGKNLGLIVINMDLNGLFNLLKSNLPMDILLYLTNANGDFLIHPDRHREFGFDHGRHYLIQDAYRPMRNLLFGSLYSEVFSVTGADALEQMLPPSSRNNGGLAASFVKLSYGELAPDRFVALGLARPLATVFEGTRQLGKSIVNISVFGSSH